MATQGQGERRQHDKTAKTSCMHILASMHLSWVVVCQPQIKSLQLLALGEIEWVSGGGGRCRQGQSTADVSSGSSL